MFIHIRRHVGVGILWFFFASVCGCKRSEAPQSPSEGAALETTEDASLRRSFSPPAPRIAYPLALLNDAFSQAPVGTLSFEDPGKGLREVPLLGVGLNVCQSGWVLQGFYREGEGVLRQTPSFAIDIANLPHNGVRHYRHPSLRSRSLNLDFREASLSRLKGSLAVLDAQGLVQMKMDVDGIPVGLAPAPGLGPRGCFTTGYFGLRHTDYAAHGPAFGVWDGLRTYYLGLRLDLHHNIAVVFSALSHRPQVGKVLTIDLSKLNEESGRFPVRVYFETRSDGDPQQEGGPTLIRTEALATEGTLRATFAGDPKSGSLRVQMDQLRFPEWSGPLSGEVVSTIRAEALFVTDQKGSTVPIPSPPPWLSEFEEGPEPGGL